MPRRLITISGFCMGRRRLLVRAAFARMGRTTACSCWRMVSSTRGATHCSYLLLDRRMAQPGRRESRLGQLRGRFRALPRRQPRILLYSALAGLAPSFPTLSEAAYFVMALVFLRPGCPYGDDQETCKPIQICNFILIYCAVTLATLFVLNQSISASVLTPVGTVVAFLYPALWFSVAAFGLISLIVYEQGANRFLSPWCSLAVFG